MSATDSLDHAYTHIASSGKYPGEQKNYGTNYNTFPRYFHVASPVVQSGQEVLKNGFSLIYFNLFL